MEKNEISEEVTVTPVIKDLERLFNRFVQFIRSIVTRLINGLQNFIAFAFHHFIILAVVVILGGCLGFFSTELMPREYESNMTVKMNVNGKEQLLNDVGYFNALIKKGALTELSELLSITELEAATLKSCEAYPYATFFEKTEALNQLYMTTDTAIYNNLDFAQLMSQNNGDLSSKFRISFTATDQTVFSKLEAPLLAYLERVPELNKLLESSQKALEFQRQTYYKEMANLDTLKKVMNLALLEQAKNSGGTGTNTYVNLSSDKQSNRSVNALDIQDRSIFYALKITNIDVAIEEHASCYFVSSHLNPFGKKIGYGKLSRAIVSAGVSFLLTILLLFFYKLSKNKA
ncbi:MAG: hypothetical protein GQ574_07420 [Crocinitomix sp.]|nr:hypothetical protein [Crocinitomix sp.]